MSDAFVPEADALDQRDETVPAEPSEAEEAGDEPLSSGSLADKPAARGEPAPALTYPDRRPLEAPEADALDQVQDVALDDEWR